MAISAINNVSFCSENATKKQKVKNKNQNEYVRTDMYKTLGATVGLGLGMLLAAADTKLIKMLNGEAEEAEQAVVKTGRKFGKLAIGGVSGALIGALFGIPMDYTINKIVENTTLSLKLKKD